MKQPSSKPAKKGGFPIGLKALGKGKVPVKPGGKGAMAPPFAKKK